MTGKLDTHTYDIGKEIKLTAIHGNRTWNFENKYEAADKELKQGSKVTWAEDVWIHYDIHVTNMSEVYQLYEQLQINSKTNYHNTLQSNVLSEFPVPTSFLSILLNY